MRNPTIILARATEARTDPPRSVSLRGLLHIVFKKKWLILLVFVLTSAAATIYALYLAAVPQYEADAEILVSPDDVRLPASGSANAASREEQIARTIRLLVGRSLAEEVVEKIGPTVLYERLARKQGRDDIALRRAAAVRLVNDLYVNPAGRSSIIVLSFRHEDPVLAARVVNLLSEMYVDRHLRVEKNPRSDAFFREQLEVLKERVAESQQALDAFRQRHGIVDTPKGGRERAAADIAGLSSALVEARSRQAGLEGQIAVLERKLEREAQIPRSYYQTKERLQELQVQESQLAATLMPQHPRLREVQDEIRSLRDVVQATGTGAPYETAAEQEQVRVTMQTELARMRAEAESARTNQVALSAQLEEARAKLQAMANIDTEFNQLQEQLRTDEQNYSLYLGRVEGARMARAMDEEKIVGVRVIEPAQIPMYPLESRRNLTIALGLVLGAGGGIGVAFLMHFLAGRLDTREDVERVLGLPVLASIAENQLKPAADAASIHDRRRREDALSG